MSANILTNPVTVPRAMLTEAETDALSTLAHVAIARVPEQQIQSGHASALLAYMSRLEIERNELRSALTASGKLRDEYLGLLQLAREPVKLIAIGGGRTRADLDAAEYLHGQLTALFKEQK